MCHATIVILFSSSVYTYHAKSVKFISVGRIQCAECTVELVHVVNWYATFVSLIYPRDNYNIPTPRSY